MDPLDLETDRTLEYKDRPRFYFGSLLNAESCKEERDRVAGSGLSESKTSLSLSLSPRPLRIVIPVLIYGGHKLDSRFIYERTFARLAPPMIKCRRWKRRLELFLFPRRL